MISGPDTLLPMRNSICIDVNGVVRIVCTTVGRITVQPAILDVGASFAATVSDFAEFPRESVRLFMLALKEALAGSHLEGDLVFVPLPDSARLVAGHDALSLQDREGRLVDAWQVSDFAGDRHGVAVSRLLARIAEHSFLPMRVAV